MKFVPILKIKSIKKGLSTLLRIVVVILLLFGIIWTALQFPKVQTYLAKQLANYYSKELKAEVDIGTLEVDFFTNVNLNEFIVKDNKNDTLVYVEKLSVDLNRFDWKAQNFALGISLYNPAIHLRKRVDSKFFNYQFLIDYFSTDKKKKNDFQWSFEVSQLGIVNAAFSFHNDHYPDSVHTINYNHLDVYPLNLEMVNMNFEKRALTAQIKRLAIQERNGFHLNNLTADFKIDPEIMSFQNLIVQTDHTELSADLSFVADSFEDYRHFSENVFMSANFRASLISIKDLAFFVPPFQYIDQQVYLDGKVSGTVSNLKAESIELQINKDTYLIGDGSIRGLPDIEKSFIHFDLDEFETTAEGLRKLPYPPFEKGEKLKVRSNFDSLGVIQFNGKFTGFYNDFVAFGKLGSRLGSVNMDLAIKENEEKGLQYRGNLKTSGFDIGRFLSIKDLSFVQLDVEVNGKGVNKNDIDATVNGKLNALTYREYQYKDIRLDGNINEKTFNGSLKVKDKNLDFDFIGIVDFNEERPISKFELNLNKALLAKLNIYNQKDTLTALKFNASFNLEGIKIDELEGSILFDSLQYVDERNTEFIDHFSLENTFKNKERTLEVKSSLLDAKVEGQFMLSTIFQDVVEDFEFIFLNSKMPYRSSRTQNFSFYVDFKRTSSITSVLMPTLKLDSSIYLNGYYRQSDQKAKISFNGRKFSYGRVSLENYQFQSTLEQDSSTMDLAIQKLKVSERVRLDSVSVQSGLKNSILITDLTWEKLNDREKDDGKIQLVSDFERLNKIDMQFVDSYFALNDSNWRVMPDHSIHIDSSSIHFRNFSLSSSSQKLMIDGKISENALDSIVVTPSNLDLAFISTFLPEKTFEMEGKAEGELTLIDAYNNSKLKAELLFEPLKINQINFEKAILKSNWIAEEKAIELLAIMGNEERSFRVDGKLYPLLAEENLDLLISFDTFPLKVFDPMIEDYISNLSGSFSGKINARGSFSEPQLNGKLKMEEAEMTVNYLNTHYEVNDEILVRPDFIGFDQLKIVDQASNFALATGSLFHKNYSEFNLDVGLEFENFLALNTTSKNNSLYFGKGVASGKANIYGTTKQLVFDIDLDAENGTDFKIPIESGVEVSNSEFLVFTNSHLKEETENEEVNLDGIKMNFNLNVKPDAVVQIIFDEQIGDIMRAQGTGNLKLEINTIGDFNIYGEFEVQKGNYLFTLQNVINKRFEIARGSRISWDGDPLNAKVDMRAIYKLRAPLYDLFPEDTNSNFRRRIPVELELQMGGLIMQPDINFDIRLPTAEENTKARLNSILYVNNNEVNKQEMNQQVFGLLVLNRFMPSANTTNTNSGNVAGSAGVNSGYEFISNQLSNWLSNMSDQIDVGVNYRPANEMNSEEVDLSLSTELLDNRLVVDGNFGYTSNNENQLNRNQNSNFIGEFTLEYKLNRDGSLRLKGFSRSTNNSLLQVNSPYTQGVGMFYREEFESFGNLWKKYFRRKSDDDSEE